MSERALIPVPNQRDLDEYIARITPRFPRDCTPVQLQQLAEVALAFGLNPLIGELMLYQGQIYITAPGRVRIADNHPAYDGYEHAPVLGDELKAMRAHEGEVIWKCTVYRRDRTHPTVAYGRAGGPKERNSVAQADPVTMAQKRAIHRALRAAFPVPIPGVEDAATTMQIRAIHAVDEELDVSREDRRAALEATFGVSASNELTAAQASAYLDTRSVDIDPETGEIRNPLDAPEGMEAEVRAIDAAADPAPPRRANPPSPAKIYEGGPYQPASETELQLLKDDLRTHAWTLDEVRRWADRHEILFTRWGDLKSVDVSEMRRDIVNGKRPFQPEPPRESEPAPVSDAQPELDLDAAAEAVFGDMPDEPAQ